MLTCKLQKAKGRWHEANWGNTIDRRRLHAVPASAPAMALLTDTATEMVIWAVMIVTMLTESTLLATLIGSGGT